MNAEANIRPDQGADSGAKARLTGVPLLIAALSVVLLVQAAFVLSYVGALHHPKPHRVAIRCRGASPLPPRSESSSRSRITRYSDESAARAAIDERKIDGAFVVDSTGAKLIVAPAASPALASALGAAFTAAGGRVRSEDRDRSGAPAACRRCRRKRFVPGRHGPDHRRLSRVDDRDGVRRQGDAATAPQLARDRGCDRGAPHGHDRGAGARGRPDVEVPGAVGASSP